MKRFLIFASAAAAMLCAATAAEAGRVDWSIGINLPPVATVISSGPGWAPAYDAPAPRYYAPAPSYYAPAPRYDEPRGRYFRPPVAYGGPYGSPYRHAQAPVYAPRPRAWLPPLPPLPRLPPLPGFHRPHDRNHFDGRGGNWR